MQTNQASWIALPFVLLVLLSGCKPSPKTVTPIDPETGAVDVTNLTKEDLQPITDVATANDALNKLEELTLGPFHTIRLREPLSEAQIQDLKTADLVVQRVIEYDPVNPGYQSIQAKIQIGLGELDKAETTLKNALINQPEDLDESTKLVYPDLHADLSRVYFEKQEFRAAFDEIQAARTVFPNDPWYMTDQASILIEISNREVSQALLDKAKELCQSALEWDPGHKPAEKLLKFLEDANATDGS